MVLHNNVRVIVEEMCFYRYFIVQQFGDYLNCRKKLLIIIKGNPMKNNQGFKTLLCASLVLLCINSNIFSQSAAPADSSKLSITGSVDVNYNYNFNAPASMINGYRNLMLKKPV